MFDWLDFNSSVIKYFDTYEAGPVRESFLLPCHEKGPTCEGTGGAYKIAQGRSPTIGEGGVGFSMFGVRFACASCRGRVMVDVQRRQHAQIQTERQASWDMYGVPPHYKEFSLARCLNVIAKGLPPRRDRKPGQTYVVDPVAAQAIKYLRTYDPRPGQWFPSVLLGGTVGSGKSHIAHAWAMDRVLAGKSVYCISEQALQSGLQSPFDSEAYAAAKGVMDRAAIAQVLVWDDLCYRPLEEQRMPDRLLTEISAVLDSRIRKQLPMVATTNCMLEGLKKRVGPAIFSRVMELTQDGERFEMTGFDWRA